MKKTIRFFSMAALALVGAVMTGCSSDDNTVNNPQPENGSVLKTTISLDNGDATTRALSVDFVNKKATKTFAVGDQIAVFYKDGKGRTMRALSNALTSGDIHNEGKTADITVDFVGSGGAAAAANSQIRFVYPHYMAQETIDTDALIDDANTIYYSRLTNQTGNLDDLGRLLDLATFDGSLSGSSLPTSVTLTNRLAILALTLKNSDGSSIITGGLENVNIVGSKPYTVMPKEGVTFGQDVIYVAIQPEATSFGIAAPLSTGIYMKALGDRTFEAGHFYNLPVRMELFPL